MNIKYLVLVAVIMLTGCGGYSSNPTGPSASSGPQGLQPDATYPLSVEIHGAGATYNGDIGGYPHFTFFGTLTNTSSSSSIVVDGWVTLQGCGDIEAHIEAGRQTYTLAPNESVVFSSSGAFTDCDNMQPGTQYKAAIHAGRKGSTAIEAFGIVYYSY